MSKTKQINKIIDNSQNPIWNNKSIYRGFDSEGNFGWCVQNHINGNRKMLVKTYYELYDYIIEFENEYFQDCVIMQS